MAKNPGRNHIDADDGPGHSPYRVGTPYNGLSINNESLAVPTIPVPRLNLQPDQNNTWVVGRKVR